MPAAYECIARSIAAYERSPEVSQFNSKYDAYLAGQATLTEQEALGRTLFEGKAMCSACHINIGDVPCSPITPMTIMASPGTPRTHVTLSPSGIPTVCFG